MANAAYRQLTIFQQLLAGQVLRKTDLATHFHVTPRAIQRDISQLRAAIADLWPVYQLTYRPADHGYVLNLRQASVSKPALLVLLKILLASRSLNTAEMTQTIDGLLALVPAADRRELLPLIKNEQFYYTPVHHQQPLLTRIWQLSELILTHQPLKFDYYRSDGQLVTRTVMPEALLFSDYYFYIATYNTQYANNIFYRVDRIRRFHAVTPATPLQPGPRMEDGLLRQRLHYMMPGQLLTIQFEFSGVPEAALDRFPTAKIITRYPSRKSVLIEAEIFDHGARMWLLGQGAMVKVVAPAQFVASMRTEITHMLAHY